MSLRSPLPRYAFALGLTLWLLWLTSVGLLGADAAIRRGQILYLANCSMCHQMNGRGTVGVYPPLAGSDFLAKRRREGIRAVVQGLEGKITVNGTEFDNRMPPAVLNDEQVAEVLNYVQVTWGNAGEPFSAAEVRELRATTRFKTFEELQKANEYPPLPAAPPGFEVRELIRLPEFIVRIASDGRGERLYLLGQNGSVSRLDVASRRLTNLFKASDYVDLSRGGASTLGMTLDSEGQLWISCNQRNDQTSPLVTNEVTLFRTTERDPSGDPIRPQAWYRTGYPYGIGPYNHGVSHLAFGPDGQLYVSSGSRTDGGETGSDPRLGRMGETDQTAVLWRFDPKASEPRPEVVARGIRNAWSFAWDASGNLFTVSNGPDAHACEEMDWVRPGENRHHGFPYQFEDWPVERKAYPHTPPVPAGTVFAHPVANLGPAATPPGRTGRTFNPHSSPAGMVWLDGSWPEAVRNGFLIGRFGNLIKTDDDVDVGFDVLAVHLERSASGEFVAHTHTWLAPLGRPIDVHVVAGRKIFVLEYTRPTNFKDQRGWLPGRILELEAKEARRG